MTDPNAEAPRATPPEMPGERRLAHPPSDRYRAAEASTLETEPVGSAARSSAFAAIGVLGGSAAIIVFGGVLALSAGLLVIAAATGWALAMALRIGAGARLPRDRRVRLAIGLALLAIALGQLGLWLYGRWEGGVLGPIDYLAETFGLLVPLQFAAAWITAWLSAR